MRTIILALTTLLGLGAFVYEKEFASPQREQVSITKIEKLEAELSATDGDLQQARLDVRTLLDMREASKVASAKPEENEKPERPAPNATKDHQKTYIAERERFIDDHERKLLAPLDQEIRELNAKRDQWRRTESTASDRQSSFREQSGDSQGKTGGVRMSDADRAIWKNKRQAAINAAKSQIIAIDEAIREREAEKDAIRVAANNSRSDLRR
ncbi:hypothetical protein N9B73_13695 [Verrucomicrobiales bacterium]|jgi:hypothetical protein|nr:hypothetical protein [Verrucomicrobiales bacterium]